MTLIDIHREIAKLKKARKDLIIERLNNRPQTFLSKYTKINNQRINNWINLSSELNPDDIKKINDALNS